MRPKGSTYCLTCVLLKLLCLSLTLTVAFGKRNLPIVAINGHLRRLSTSVTASKCFKISSIQKCGSSAQPPSQSTSLSMTPERKNKLKHTILHAPKPLPKSHFPQNIKSNHLEPLCQIHASLLLPQPSPSDLPHKDIDNSLHQSLLLR